MTAPLWLNSTGWMQAGDVADVNLFAWFMRRGMPEALTYLGWPLIIVLIAAGILFWRDVRVLITAVTWAVLELCSLGGAALPVGRFRLPGAFLPYYWIQSLPAMG
jgi:hypothetical protein